MSKKLGQEPAFPISSEAMKNRPPEHIGVGMDKRFYAACAAMQGQIANRGLSLELNRLSRDVEYAYRYADELLKQENE